MLTVIIAKLFHLYRVIACVANDASHIVYSEAPGLG